MTYAALHLWFSFLFFSFLVSSHLFYMSLLLLPGACQGHRLFFGARNLYFAELLLLGLVSFRLLLSVILYPICHFYEGKGVWKAVYYFTQSDCCGLERYYLVESVFPFFTVCADSFSLLSGFSLLSLRTHKTQRNVTEPPSREDGWYLFRAEAVVLCGLFVPFWTSRLGRREKAMLWDEAFLSKLQTVGEYWRKCNCVIIYLSIYTSRHSFFITRLFTPRYLGSWNGGFIRIHVYTHIRCRCATCSLNISDYK